MGGPRGTSDRDHKCRTASFEKAIVRIGNCQQEPKSIIEVLVSVPSCHHSSIEPWNLRPTTDDFFIEDVVDAFAIRAPGTHIDCALRQQRLSKSADQSSLNPLRVYQNETGEMWAREG